MDRTELRRLWEAATKGEWKVTPSPSEECLYIDLGVATVFTDYSKPSDTEQATADLIAATHNALPGLLDALDRQDLAAGEAEHWRSLLVSLDKEGLCDVHLGMGAEEYLAHWLASRDARQRKIGAAEWLERHAGDTWTTQGQGDMMRQIAARLRKEGE